MKSILIWGCGVFLVNFSIRAADWPQWRGPEHNGVSQEIFPASLPEALPIRWKAKVGAGFSSVVVVGNRALTMGNEEDRDSVWCLDSETGDVLWQHSYDCPLDPLDYEGGPGGSPTIHEGSVFTMSKKGHAFRLDLESGEVIWSRDLIADHELDLLSNG